MFILKPLIRSATRSEAEKEVDLLPRTVAEIEAARKDEGLLALSKAAGLLEEGEPLDKQEELELKNRIISKLDESPRKGFRIVQDWLEEEPTKVAA
jgi:flagellar biosynthesis/type III secretory pathway M-ring protein FliF/YscJ